MYGELGEHNWDLLSTMNRIPLGIRTAIFWAIFGAMVAWTYVDRGREVAIRSVFIALTISGTCLACLLLTRRIARTGATRREP